MGFFEFVFGKSVPKDDTQGNQPYYLSDDDAKSFGDIEYMRSVKTVRRTFAKKKGQTEHMESVKQISATKATAVEENSGYSPSQTAFSSSSSSTSSSRTSSATPAAVPTTPRRTAARSNDMDMFRNMAKKIRK